jgi:hypothetical protein
MVLGGMTLVTVRLPTRFAVLCVVGLLAPVAAILSGDAKRFMLFLLLLDVPLGLDTHLGYESEFLAHPNGVSFSLTTVSIAVLYAIWLVEAFVTNETKADFFPSVSLPALSLFAAGLVSTLNARYPRFSAFQIVQSIEVFLVYFYIANHVRSEEDVKMIVQVLLIGLFLEGTLMSVQYLTKTQFDLMFKHVEEGVARGDTLFRPEGTFGSPNPAAGYLVPLLLIGLSIILSRQKVVQRVLVWVPFGVGLVALLVTFSRGGWLSFLVGVCFLMAVHVRDRWRNVSPSALLLSIAGAGVGAVAFGGAVVYRVSTRHDTAMSRVPLMHLAFNMIEAHPWIGVGLNNFGLVMRDYVTRELINAWLYIVHNKYLLVWAEMGTVGLLCFLWFLGSVFREGLRCLRSSRVSFYPVAAGAMAGLSGYAVHMLFDVFDHRGLVQLLWVLAGLVVGMGTFLLPEERMREADAAQTASAG